MWGTSGWQKYFNWINFLEISRVQQFPNFFRFIFASQDYVKFRVDLFLQFEGISAKKKPKMQVTITHKMDLWSQFFFRVD